MTHDVSRSDASSRVLLVRSADCDADAQLLMNALAAGLVQQGRFVAVVHPEGERVGDGIVSIPLPSGSASGSVVGSVAGSAPGKQSESSIVDHLAGVVGQFDIVHAFGLRAAAHCALALHRKSGGNGRRVPRLVATLYQTAYWSTSAERFMNTALGRIVVDASDHVMCVAQDIQNFIEGLGHTSVSRAVVPELWSSDCPSLQADWSGEQRPSDPHDGQMTTRLRREVEVPPGKFMALVAAELQPRASIDLVIDAMSEPVVREKWQLVIVGQGPQEGRLRQQEQRLFKDIKSPITWLANHPRLPDLIAASDALVVSSQWEGKPQAIQHALRVGTPVVATCTGGIPELVGAEHQFSTEGVAQPRTTHSYDINGAAMLFAVDDEGAVRDALRDLSALPIRVRLSEFGRAQALKLATLDDALAQLDEVYGNALRHPDAVDTCATRGRPRGTVSMVVSSTVEGSLESSVSLASRVSLP